MTRVHSASDNAEPSGQSAIAAALVEYALLTGSADSLELADAALAVGGGLAEHDPRFAGWTLAAAEARVAGPVSVVIIRSSPDEGAELIRSARQAAPSGALVVAARPDQDGVPEATDRGLIGGRPAAYICRGTVCSAPATDPEQMRVLLRGDAHSMPWDHQE